MVLVHFIIQDLRSGTNIFNSVNAVVSLGNMLLMVGFLCIGLVNVCAPFSWFFFPCYNLLFLEYF